MEYEIDKKEKTNQLKIQLQQKLKDVQSILGKLKSQLSINLSKQNENIIKSNKSFVEKFKNKYNDCLKNNKEIKEKEKQSEMLFNINNMKMIKKIKEIEIFNKNLNDTIICSMENYNSFLLDKLPYYKESSSYFLFNHEQKLSDANIFSKLNQKQINEIYEKIKNKNLCHFINGKHPSEINIDFPTDNFIEDKFLLDSNSFYKLKIQLNNLNDEYFKEFFNNSFNIKNIHKRNNEKIIFEKCELKKIDISLIPNNIKHLKFYKSKISYSIFKRIQFTNLISLNLDYNRLDSENFEKILKILLSDRSQISHHLKILSAKNNFITRIIKLEDLKKIQNKFNSLEIINLANNSISEFHVKLLNLFPKIKLIDLSNNILNHQYTCKELLENCKGIVLLAKNIGVMQKSMNDYYLDYYLTKINEKDSYQLSINLDSLLYKRNVDNYMNKDISNTKYNFNITELNFSSCNLTNENAMKLIKNCSNVNSNITKINLSLNLITETIFNLLVDEDIYILLNKLSELDLSYNQIKFIQLEKYDSNWKIYENPLTKFIYYFPTLELLILKGTPIEEKLNEYIKKEVIIYMELVKKNVKGKLEKDLNEYRDIFEKKYLKINPKFHLKINDSITNKYVKRIKQVNAYDFNNLIFDNVKDETKDK